MESTYYILFLVGAFFILISSVLTLIGADSESEVEGDSVGILYFVKLSIFFITGLGGGGLHAIHNGATTLSETLPYGIGLGIVFSLLFISIVYGFSKLKKEDPISYTESIGKKGEVTISIPANESGIGKINVIVGSSLREVEAMTKEDIDLKLNSSVIVTEIEGNVFYVTQNKTGVQNG